MSAAPPLIVHVIHHLVTGGMENGLVNLINHLPVGAYRHAVVCIEDYSDFRQRIVRPDVDVVAMHRSRIGSRRLRSELFRLFRRMQPTLLHTRNLSGLDALLPARLAGVRHCIHSEHGWDVDNLHGQRWRPLLLRRLHAPLVGHYITVSKDLQRFLIERIGVRQSRITQIYNGVDTRRFRPRSPTTVADGSLPPAFRGDHLIRVGTVGRLQPVKDQATLLQAFASLLQLDPALRRVARLIVVGDGPLRNDLTSLARTLGILELTWFAGARTDIESVLPLFDAFVLPSLNEGISNTLLEAMAAGVPVLAARVGGNVELVEDGVVGRLLPVGDPDALAAALAGYVHRPDVRREHGSAARELAVRRFSLQNMMTAYQDVYDGALSVKGLLTPTSEAG